jgi:hypothetical protein
VGGIEGGGREGRKQGDGGSEPWESYRIKMALFPTAGGGRAGGGDLAFVLASKIRFYCFAACSRCPLVDVIGVKSASFPSRRHLSYCSKSA